MIKCKIIVKNDYGVGDATTDDPYFLEIKLPALPFIGMYVGIDLSPLENLVCQDLNIARLFFSKDKNTCYFYNNYHDHFCIDKKNKEDILEEDLKYLSFSDVNWVSDIFMKANDELVYIELSTSGYINMINNEHKR